MLQTILDFMVRYGLEIFIVLFFISSSLYCLKVLLEINKQMDKAKEILSDIERIMEAEK